MKFILFLTYYQSLEEKNKYDRYIHYLNHKFSQRPDNRNHLKYGFHVILPKE